MIGPWGFSIVFQEEIPNGFYNWFTAAFLSPDGQTLFTADSISTIQLRDPQTRAVRSTFPARTRGAGIATLTRDGQTLIDATGAGGDFGITLWNLSTQFSNQF
ncbi:hypothetical protein H6F89_04665 [Cyanobacteria bacterium FACHB-63]|nr:hypothetical protein [Cyanobacteria bacterium FACHB-63]